MARSASIRRGRNRHARAAAGPRRQRGVGLLIVLLAIVVAAGYAAMRGLNAAYAQSDRDARTLAAMQQAKQALLGYAANRARLLGASPSIETLGNVPGALPCPAQTLAPANVNFGAARTTCTPSLPSFPNLLVGRLPWKTLEVPEITDANGEPLWYAVSLNFRLQSLMTPINPDSQGRIRLVDDLGNVTQSRVVAVVIAPGRALPGQQRVTTADLHGAGNYLERFTVMPVAGIDFDFYGGRPTSAAPAFNDIILTITEQELFDAVASAVATRMEQTVMPLLEAHRTFWGTLPYATGSFDATQAVGSLRGVAGALSGHLPVGPTAAPVQFVSPTKQSGTATVSCTGGAQLSCTVGDNPVGTVVETFVIRATVSNVNGGVFDPLAPQTSLPSNLGVSIAAAPIGATLDADLTVTGTVTGMAAFVLEPVQRLQASAPDTALRPQEWWFDYAGWARYVYYSRCATASGACITVEQPAAAAQSARAVLVVAGRPVMKPDLSAQTRPSANAADYFEAPHDALPVTAFRRQLRTSTFNDRVVMLP